MKKMQITSTNGATGNLQDHISVLDDFRLGRFNYPNTLISRPDQIIPLAVLTNFDRVLPHPDQRFHRLAAGVCVLGPISSGVCQILFRDGIVTMAHGFLGLKAVSQSPNE